MCKRVQFKRVAEPTHLRFMPSVRTALPNITWPQPRRRRSGPCFLLRDHSATTRRQGQPNTAAYLGSAAVLAPVGFAVVEEVDTGPVQRCYLHRHPHALSLGGCILCCWLGCIIARPTQGSARLQREAEGQPIWRNFQR